ncbi:MAG: hypothetical protein AAF927_26495 [Bacteroidota bacterium]
MKVNVSRRNIAVAIESQGKRSPIEIAIIELDCFEEVRLSRPTTNRFRLEVDGQNVKLNKKVQSALLKFHETQEMEPLSFDLPLGEEMLLGGGEFFVETMDDFYGFGMNY